jgi:sortase A
VRWFLGLTCLGAGAALILALLLPGHLDARQTARAQERLLEDVPAQPAVVPGRSSRPSATPVPHGEALAVMRIPRFGAEWEWAALEGTSLEVIADGPGHYPRTPLPGQRGNVAFAAHRAGHGDPFIDFDTLRPGDRVELEQGGTVWVYEIDTRPEIVPVSASWVLDPLPGRRLTLTTCWPKYGSSKRMYVRAHLVAVG